jgi:tetratricopeptide (TPR) repeat protein
LIVIFIFSTISCVDQVKNNIEKGDAAAATGDWAGSTDWYGKAIEANPKNVESYYKRGIAQRNNNNYTAAIADFDTVLKLDPSFSPAYAARALTFALASDLKSAMADMDIAIDMDNNNARTIEENMVDAYFKLGMAYRDHGGSIKAQAFLGKVIRIRPEWAPVYIERSKVYTFIEAYDLTIIDLTRAIRYDPAAFEAYILRAEAYMAQGKYELALKDADKSITLNGESSLAYKDRGAIYYFTREYDRALLDLNKAIILDPLKYQAFYYRALVYKEQKMNEPAAQDFRTVMSLKDVDPDILTKTQGYLSEVSVKTAN